jgi:2-keto-3-deoxy-6-phosphogluconate aldolase
MDIAQIAALTGAIVALVILVPRMRRIGGGVVLRHTAVWLALAVILAIGYRSWMG